MRFSLALLGALAAPGALAQGVRFTNTSTPAFTTTEPTSANPTSTDAPVSEPVDLGSASLGPGASFVTGPNGGVAILLVPPPFGFASFGVSGGFPFGINIGDLIRILFDILVALLDALTKRDDDTGCTLDVRVNGASVYNEALRLNGGNYQSLQSGDTQAGADAPELEFIQSCGANPVALTVANVAVGANGASNTGNPPVNPTETDGTPTGTETDGSSPTGTETDDTGAPTGTETDDTGAPTGTETDDTGAPTGTETDDTGAPTGTETDDTGAPTGTETNGSEPTGTETNGSEPTGTDTDGSEPTGTETDGSATGTETDGSEPTGTETDGSATGTETDGAATGTETDGAATGTETDGAATGTETDGAATGTETDGSATGTETDGSGTATGTETDATTTASSVPGFPPTSNGFVFFGCTGSSSGFPTFELALSSPQMDIDLCSSTCQGSDYFGVYDTDCYCGDEVDGTSTSIVDSGLCDIECPGDDSQNCGGDAAASRRSRIQARQNVPNSILLTVYISAEFSGPGTSIFVTDVITATVTDQLTLTTTFVTTLTGPATTQTATVTAIYECFNGRCFPQDGGFNLPGGSGGRIVYIFKPYPGEDCDGQTVYIPESCSCKGGSHYVPIICHSDVCHGKTVYKPEQTKHIGGGDIVFTPVDCHVCKDGNVIYKPWEDDYDIIGAPGCTGSSCPPTWKPGHGGSAPGGGSSAPGGGSSAPGGGSSAPGGGSSAPGGGSSAPGGGSSAPGGGSSAPSGGSSAPGGGSSAPGGGSSAPGSGSSAPGGGSSAPGGGSSAPGGGSSAPGGGSSAPGGGSSAPGGGSSAPGGGSSAPGGGSAAPGGGEATGTKGSGGDSAAPGGGSAAPGGGSAAPGGGDSAAPGGGETGGEADGTKPVTVSGAGKQAVSIIAVLASIFAAAL
ncbi:hypothetical protein B0J15DRAFT_573988 [Fusarium solani]|uniref:WSC domain-containing protein n=1 Tax=Fusarium solani TaxID=169388 RepID=A0A9P9L331_FUSSL|nr:uncharacterized protein B0J15DRAFT_573988 [Fusarium solani]KAH7273147.1 hypothetical protein B0J15DRAFT_573988 [Fusarium solani]